MTRRAARPTWTIDRPARRLLVALALLTALLVPLAPIPTPVAGPVRPAAAQAAPGWMTAEQRALFTNGWPALVPSSVPEPFASVTPTITVTGDSYRLYWVVFGGAPTFLEVQGYLNGYIPAGSEYDRNVELVIDSSVRGNPAYRDLTPVYDAVFWREGTPSYWARAQNLGVDIVSFANAFTSVAAGAPVPTATTAPVASVISPDAVASGELATVTTSGGGTGATLTADGGTFSDTGTATYAGAGDASVSWVAPDVAQDTTVTFTLVGADGSVIASTPTLVRAGAAADPSSLACPATVAAGDLLAVTVTGAGNVQLVASSGAWPVMSPNTDYDPGMDAGGLAFSLAGGGSATLVWQAPATAGTATITASGQSGIAFATCGVTVVGGQPTVAATVPAATGIPATARATAPVATNSGTTATETTVAGSTATVPASPGDGLGGPGTGTATATAPGTNPGDGLGDLGDATVTPRPGDGTDIGGAATLPPTATYPAAPTSAALPSAPAATGDQPGGQQPGGVQPTTVPATATPTPAPTVVPATVVPATSTAVPAAPATSPPAPATETPIPATVIPATATVVPATATAVPAVVTPTIAPTRTPRVPPTPTATPDRGGEVAAVPPSAAPTATTQAATATATATVAVPAATATRAATATPVPSSTVTLTPIATSTSTAAPTATPATPVPSPTVPATEPPATPVPLTEPVLTTSAATPASTPLLVPSAAAEAPIALAATPPDQTATVAVAPSSTATAAPTAPPPANAVSQVIGVEGGTVTHPGGGAVLVDPATFDTRTTVRIASVPDSSLPVSPDVDLVPSSAFDIAIYGEDGQEIRDLPEGVRLTIDLPAATRDAAVIFWVEGDRLEQLGVTDRDGEGISAPLPHLSRFVAGVPVAERPEVGWIAWAFAIAAALSGLIVVGLLARGGRRNRARTVRP